MTGINALLNLTNSDYFDSLNRKNREADDSQLTAREQAPAKQLEQRLTIQKIQETAETQQASRKLRQIEYEIEQLSMSQAHMLMRLVSDKIAQSTAQQLGNTQMPGERNIMAPAYI